MSAPQAVLDLVAHFERDFDRFKSGQYNEAQLRIQFLDPFFEALGWDVYNRNKYAEAYKDVIHEDALRIGTGVKAPDYCFQIGGARKFFLEAKKPSVFIKEEISPAYQLRRYAWTAKLALSVLSDFEEFAIYDCRIKPKPSDKASTARIFYCTFRELVDKWDYIVSIFSRDAVLKGSFDKYAAENKAKRGTTEVDAEFLEEIESWRKRLAENLALRNQELSKRELNFSVQRIIDRIIFLRIAEDRGLETYGRLQALTSGPRIYPRLCQLFEAADDRYNSGLFHFQKERGRHEAPDELTLGLEIDDKLLKDIFKKLYYPDSPYAFSVLSADILGQVYEQFLGKVITLTAGHHAKVDDKPEVKKAGGVYYTPTYVVDYIVRETVGKLVQGKTPKRVAELSVLDPACGSGSFLIGAYQFLLEWHLTWYIQNDPAEWAREITRAKRGGGVKLKTAKHPVLVRTKTGGWQLSIAERKRILLDNIYGVDIDGQAVEVTKLSLLLKVLEGDVSLAQLTFGLEDRVLPDLGDNIKCGNSLIGPDFYAQPDLPDLSDEERYRINVFDWHAEFPEVFKAGGFDAVIGNPPYVRQESLSAFKNYFKQHYEAFDGVADLYTYFMEQSLKLLREDGFFSIIVSSSFLRATYGEPLRRTLKKNATVVRIVDFGGLAVFANAKDTYVCIPVLVKGAKQTRVQVSKVGSLKNLDLSKHVATNHYTIPHERLSPEAWSLKSDAEAAVFSKIGMTGEPLGDYVNRKFFRGLLTGLNEAFELTAEQRSELAKEHRTVGLIKPFVGGQDIRRFQITDSERFLIVIPCGWTRKQMVGENSLFNDASERGAWNWLSKTRPKLATHFAPFADSLKKRHDKGEYWWELRPCDYYQYFDRPKIIFPDICKGPRFCLDTSGIYLANTAYCLGTDDRYLLGFLNSRLFWFAIANISIPFGIRAGEYRYRLIYQYMEKVPIRVIDKSNASDNEKHDRIVHLVTRTLDLHRQRAAARTPQEQNNLDRQIESTDREIDRLVYELYGLTEKEIRIVEGTEPIAEQSIAEPAPEVKPARLPQGQSTPQSEADAAHFYSAKEDPVPYRTTEP
jgi:type I restriction-modification system DNA methylase subunit